MFNRWNKYIKKLNNKKKTTIKDIANVLGITPSAVSKALNDHPRISNQTKLAVKQVAENLNYQPNQLATALRKGKSHLVGVIIPRANSSFFSSVVQYMEEKLNQEGYNVIITQSNESYEKECSNIDTLLQTQTDGIIASLANETTNLKYYSKIKQKEVPLIMFDRSEDELKVDYIGIDDYMSSFLVVEHLVKQQCKRIAHIAGYRHTRIYKNRIKGFKDALENNGLAVDENLILESALSIEDGRQIMTKLLQLPNPPDAVYAAGDYAALGALQILKERKINVPNDIALVGFSDEPFTSLVTPSITTVNQHSKKIGQLAANTFLKRVDNPLKNSEPENIILKPELIIRESSKKNL